MKALILYITEHIKHLPAFKRGIIVFDIDDTLLKADNNGIGIWKREPGKEPIRLTTSEFAKDPDTWDRTKQSWYDYSEFGDPKKVYDSIINGTPIIKNLRIMDAYLNAGYEFCFLTARQQEDVIKRAIDKVIKMHTPSGEVKALGNFFNKALSHAVNDKTKNYVGATDAEKKSNILTDLCSKYDTVVFVDDDEKNVKAAKELKLKNLKIIKAWSI